MRNLGDIFHGFLFKHSEKRIAREIELPLENQSYARLYHLRMMNEEALRERAMFYRRALEKYDLYAIDEKQKKYVPVSVANVMGDGEKSIVDYIEFLYIMQHPRNVSLLLEVLPEGFLELLKKIVTKHFLYIGDGEKAFGKPCVLQKQRGWSYGYEVVPELDGIFFLRETWGKHRPGSGDYDQENYMFAQCEDCQMYLPLVFGEEMAMNPLENLPEKECLACFSGEDYIFTVLPMMESLYDGGNLAFNKNKLPVAQLKAAMKMLCLPEYFADGDKMASVFNATFVVNFYTLYCDNDYDNKLTQGQDKLKDLLQHVHEYQYHLFRLLLPHVPGTTKALIDSCTVCDLSENILAVLKESADKGWMPIEKVCLRTRCVKHGAEYAATLFNSFLFDKRVLHNDYTGKSIFLDDLFADITYPYIKAYLFMLAGFGFVEVAYEEHFEKKGRSYFDGLRYVRLTELGKYALGLADKYVVKEKEKVKCFELDDSNLIAKSVVSPNPYESVLAGMAEHVSKHMYKVTYESFLTGCQSKGDIVSRISLFREYICKEPPAIWEAFFAQVQERWQPMTEPKKKYTLYQIPQGNKELQRIILSDPVIRKCSVKAEGFLLLVETASLRKFKDALLKYGFTMK